VNKHELNRQNFNDYPRLFTISAVYGTYYKSKLGLKSDLSENLPVNYKFNCDAPPI